MPERHRLQLSCVGHLSDRVADLHSGAVVPDGIGLTYFALSPREAFRRLLRDEFDCGEMSLATYIVTAARGGRDFVAIPVFPSRTFRHSAIYVRSDGSVVGPRDLVGRRVGVPEYQMTAAVWVRGMLEHDHQVTPADIDWVTGGLRDAGRRALVDVQVPGVKITHDSRRSLDDLLLAGEIDAIIAPQAPPSYTARPGEIVRLFKDYRAVEADYYRRTGLFPIMHTVVIRRRLYETHRWIALSLYEAFERAKANAIQRVLNTEPLPVSLPWIQSDIEDTLEIMGPDFWPYGLEDNQRVLDALCSYLHEQGLCERRMVPADLFAPTVIDIDRTKTL